MVSIDTKFLVVKGPAACGKTTSIIEFVRELTETEDFHFLCKKDHQRYDEISKFCVVPYKPRDFQCSVLYRNKLVYITTFGDDAAELDKRIENHFGYVDYIVCGSRPDDSRHKKFQELFELWNITEDSCITKERCTNPENFAEQNMATAKLLKDKLDGLIRGK